MIPMLTPGWSRFEITSSGKAELRAARSQLLRKLEEAEQRADAQAADPYWSSGRDSPKRATALAYGVALSVATSLEPEAAERPGTYVARVADRIRRRRNSGPDADTEGWFSSAIDDAAHQVESVAPQRDRSRRATRRGDSIIVAHHKTLLVLRDGEEVLRVALPSGVDQLVVSPDARAAMIVVYPYTLCHVDLVSGAMVELAKGYYPSVSIIPWCDGVAFTSRSSLVVVSYAWSGEQLPYVWANRDDLDSYPEQSIESCAVSRDGSRIAVTHSSLRDFEFSPPRLGQAYTDVYAEASRNSPPLARSSSLGALTFVSKNELLTSEGLASARDLTLLRAHKLDFWIGVPITNTGLVVLHSVAKEKLIVFSCDEMNEVATLAECRAEALGGLEVDDDGTIRATIDGEIVEFRQA